MKKKIGAIVLTMFMLVSMAGCGEKSTAYSKMLKANEEMAKAGSYSMDMDASITMDYAEENIEMGMNGTSKIKMLDEINFEAEQIINMDIMGMSVEMTQWFKDGKMYQDTLGQKYVTEIPMEEAYEQMSQSEVLSFAEDMIKEQSVDEKDLSFVLDGSAMTAFVDQQMGSLTGAVTEDAKIEIGDVQLVVSLDDKGNLKEYTIKLDMAMEVEGETMDMTMDMKLSNIQIGEVELNFPDDLDTYEELEL